MVRHLSIDVETFSSVDLKKAGLHKYVQSPDFQIMLLAYAWDDGPVQLIDLMDPGRSMYDYCDGSPYSQIIQALNDPTVIKHAYNAAFEIACFSKEWPTDPAQWRCTMAHGLYCGYTAGLGATGEAVGIPQDKRKLGVGGSLIRTFCVPCKPTKVNGQRTRTLPHHEPEKWELFKQYCIQDVEAEREIERRLSAWPMPESEQALWVQNVAINNRGAAIDLPFVESALHCDQVVAERLLAEARAITGLHNPKSPKQLKDWLNEELDEELPNLQKATVKEFLGTTESGPARRMLELRQELSKTSTAKYSAMQGMVCDDGRVHGMLMYYGASRTGRWSGAGIQPQNLPKNLLEDDLLDLARRLTLQRKIEHLDIVFGSVADTLSQLIRCAFRPSPGNQLFVADFSAIEARVIAWLAGEHWRNEVFATHGKIYEASASQMFGVPLELIKRGNPEYALRQKGKVAELALGYQGGPPALIRMGALKNGLTEEELPGIVKLWRASSKRICDLWQALERTAITVVDTGRPSGTHGLLFAREYDPTSGQDFLTIQLPSGRKLFYAKPFLAPGRYDKQALYYFGANQTTKKWGVIGTYGGKLSENVTQAIARDCLAESLTAVEEAGYDIIFHVHDELVIDARPGQSLDEVLSIMRRPISWAPGLILNAAGFTSEYYKKD